MTLNWPFLKITLIGQLKKNLFKKTETPKINLESEQPPNLTEIGASLQKARLDLGLSLKGISLKTQIPIRTLEAIEAGIVDTILPKVYVKAIIKKYATVLNQDSPKWLEDFSPPKETPKLTSSKKLLKLPNLQIKPIHIYFIYILLIFFTVQKIAETIERPIIVINKEQSRQKK